MIKNKKALENQGLFMWYLQESNQGHTDFQSVALPTELRYQLNRGANLTEIFILQKKYLKKLK
jgi:type III pantothenate kinase